MLAVLITLTQVHHMGLPSCFFLYERFSLEMSKKWVAQVLPVFWLIIMTSPTLQKRNLLLANEIFYFQTKCPPPKRNLLHNVLIRKAKLQMKSPLHEISPTDELGESRTALELEAWRKIGTEIKRSSGVQRLKKEKRRRGPCLFLTIHGNDKVVGIARDEHNEWWGGIPKLR